MAESLKQEQPEQAIDRLIRCRKTHRYFCNGQWTDDPSKASVFSDEMDAVQACVHHHLNDIDLVLRAPGASTDLFATQLR